MGVPTTDSEQRHQDTMGVKGQEQIKKPFKEVGSPRADAQKKSLGVEKQGEGSGQVLKMEREPT